jgi:hypothetical protein
VEDSYEHGCEPSGSIKCCKILEWLSDWQLLKKGSAPLNLSLFQIVCQFYFVRDETCGRTDRCDITIMLSWKKKNIYVAPFHELKCPQPPLTLSVSTCDIIVNKNAFNENNTEATYYQP